MRTDPHAPSPYDDSASSTSAASPAPAPGPPSGAVPSPQQAGSGALARVLTALYALVVTPLATGLVMYGGLPWQQFLLTRGADIEGLMRFLSSPNGIPSVLAMVGGLLLVVSVVATGLASSAGLLSVSVLSVIPLSLSVMPQLLTSLYEILPEFLSTLSYGLFSQGLPLVLYPVLGGLGVALMIARRRPRPPLALSLTGVVLLPAMMLVGSLLTMYAYSVIMRHYAITFGAEPVPVSAALALVAGMVLLWLSVGAAGVSPYSLVLPALFLLGFSLAFLLPDFFLMMPSIMFSQTGSAALSVLAVGAGPAVGIALLAHTAVQLVVASRARRRLRSRSTV